MKYLGLSFLCLLLFVGCTSAESNHTVEWRYDRTGIFSKESGLLKSWPEAGPQLLWHFDGLNDGYSSPVIDNGKIFVTGMTDSIGYVYAFDLKGNLLNKAAYGKEWTGRYRGPLGTITPNDGKLYIHTGDGELICMDQHSFNIDWRVSSVNDFGGGTLTWGLNESPLVVDNMVILSAGGPVDNIVALNKKDGSIIWSSVGTGLGDFSAYCSPLFVANQEVPQIVTMMKNHIVGLDVKTGETLWMHEFVSQRGIYPNTPVYDGKDMLLFVSGYEKGSEMLRLTNGGRSVESVWESTEFGSKTGGAVKIGNYAYSSGDRVKGWYAMDWNTGEMMFRDPAFGGSGVTIAADGKLYVYSERGDMALVNPTPEKFDVISHFPITLGTDHNWAHPIIYNGIMYVRRGNTLMAYKVK